MGPALAATSPSSWTPTDTYPQHIGDAPLPPLHVRTQDKQQQALNHLLDLRNPQLIMATKLAADHRSALVDALWSQTPTPGDVAINGRTLMIRVNAGNPQAVCQDMAQLVWRYGDDIDTVAIETGLSGKPARCVVAARGHL